MKTKDKFFIMRTSPEDRDNILSVAVMTKKASKSEAIRLALSFILENPITFRFWLGMQDD